MSGPLSYHIQLADGRVVRRHQDQDHIRKCTIPEPAVALPIQETVLPPAREVLPTEEPAELESPGEAEEGHSTSQECPPLNQERDIENLPTEAAVRRYPLRERRPPDRLM